MKDRNPSDCSKQSIWFGGNSGTHKSNFDLVYICSVRKKTQRKEVFIRTYNMRETCVCVNDGSSLKKDEPWICKVNPRLDEPLIFTQFSNQKVPILWVLLKKSKLGPSQNIEPELSTEGQTLWLGGPITSLCL